MPVVALRGLVVLPGRVEHFDVSRRKSMAALEDAMLHYQKVLLVTQKNPDDLDPGADGLFEYGTLCEIRQMARLPKENGRVMVEGVERVRISRQRSSRHTRRVENDLPAFGITRIQIRGELFVIDDALIDWPLLRARPVVAASPCEPEYSRLVVVLVPDIAYDRPVFLHVHALDGLDELSDRVCEFRGCFLVLVNKTLQVGEVLAITVVAVGVNESNPGPAPISIEALRFEEGFVDITDLWRVRKDLLTRDEIAVMDGGKCILQLRGVRPFFSDKYDLTKHPNYKYTSDYDKKYTFDIEKYLNRRMKLKADDEYDVIEA